MAGSIYQIREFGKVQDVRRLDKDRAEKLRGLEAEIKDRDRAEQLRRRWRYRLIEKIMPKIVKLRLMDICLREKINIRIVNKLICFTSQCEALSDKGNKEMNLNI